MKRQSISNIKITLKDVYNYMEAYDNGNNDANEMEEMRMKIMLKQINMK